VRVDRGSRTAIIDRPALTFGIGIQPGLIQDMQPNAKRKFRSSGLFARFFWCYPASNLGKRDMARRGAISVEMANRYRAAVLGLLDIQPDTNDQGEETEHVLTLSEAARNGWITFAQRIEDGQAEGGKLESLRDWCAKLPGGALRIAGLLHLAEHGFKNGTEINADTMRRAVRLCALLIPHAVAVFDMVGADPGIEDAKVLWRWIERQGETEFKRNDIHRAFHNRFAKLDRLTAALELLKGRALIAGPYKGAASGGRPPVIYRVNPLALVAA
jgi:putative DNA primase/helicase